MYCEFETLKQCQDELNNIKYPGPCTKYWDTTHKTLQDTYIIRSNKNIKIATKQYDEKWFANDCEEMAGNKEWTK